MCQHRANKVCDHTDNRPALASCVRTQTHCCRLRRNPKVHATHKIHDRRRPTVTHRRSNAGRTCPTSRCSQVTKQHRTIQPTITGPYRVSTMFSLGGSARKPTDIIRQTDDRSRQSLIYSRVARLPYFLGYGVASPIHNDHIV